MTKTIYVLAGAMALAASGLTVSAAYADGTDKLKPHRAVYDLRLDKASDRSGISGMDGRIVYEMQGNKCDGYTTRFRFLTTVQTPRRSFTNDQRTSSFESGDGKSFSFVNQSYLNGQLEKEVRGSAEKVGTALKVQVTKPEKLDVTLGDGAFMTEHIGKMIEAARNEQTIVTTSVFDGSENGDSMFETTAIIGKAKAANTPVDGEPEEVSKQFADQTAWPVSVSYFKQGDQDGVGEKLPIYQVSFLLHESGVSRRLKMQYDDYSLAGVLKQIEFLDEAKCE